MGTDRQKRKGSESGRKSNNEYTRNMISQLNTCDMLMNDIFFFASISSSLIAFWPDDATHAKRSRRRLLRHAKSDQMTYVRYTRLSSMRIAVYGVGWIDCCLLFPPLPFSSPFLFSPLLFLRWPLDRRRWRLATTSVGGKTKERKGRKGEERRGGEYTSAISIQPSCLHVCVPVSPCRVDSV